MPKKRVINSKKKTQKKKPTVKTAKKKRPKKKAIKGHYEDGTFDGSVPGPGRTRRSPTLSDTTLLELAQMPAPHALEFDADEASQLDGVCDAIQQKRSPTIADHIRGRVDAAYLARQVLVARLRQEITDIETRAKA